jgi:1,4-alpha-glucan branching enzyme
VSRRGYLALVLHAHLPFVRHPEHPRFFEENWLFEAITDSYLPLIDLLRRAASQGSGFHLTLSVSPTLLSMLGDALLKGRYLDYLERLARLCRREHRRAAEPGRAKLARYYGDRVAYLRGFYRDELATDLIGAWRALEDAGVLELMTTAASHAYLPLLRSEPSAVRAQLRVARDHFAEIFGRPPRGLWLPECGYYPGLEGEVADAGFHYIILDAHGLQQAVPPPPAGIYRPARSQAVAVFGRDPESAEEVWSRDRGYPRHALYREYHWDLGYEADAAANLGDFLPPGVRRGPTGLKYFRVTGGRGAKAAYDPAPAFAQADRDAQAFLAARWNRISALSALLEAPVIVAPYDAELFGHWWFEGPAFLEALGRHLAAVPAIKAITLGEYLDRFGTASAVQPAASSWGERGYNAAWLRAETGWVHLRLHQAAAELKRLVAELRRLPASDWKLRVLRQAARSLLIAQGSDWTFQMGQESCAEHAEGVVRDQLARFAYLTEALRSEAPNLERVVALERIDNLFPVLDLAHFA